MKVSATHTQISNQLCPHIRLDCQDVIKTINMLGDRFTYKLNYGYVSQRGYYPNSLDKANQDSYLICESILGDTSCHLFGIFDGHGEVGDYCSHFAADQTAGFLEKELTASGGLQTLKKQPEMHSLLTKSFVKTNKALHKSSIDDTLSGTTAITVLVHGDILYVANVGDSRAIMASSVGNKVQYSPLSNDQTPFRKDERERLKKKGAKIMTIEQLEGHEPIHENWGEESPDEIDENGDPPRVWDQSLERPGCAFTRSIGDSVAEAVGVYAEPEILVWKLTPNDKFFVIASDGVFEFLTSQAVVDYFVKIPDPLQAAKEVVAESYRLWLTYDDRTDDITVIVVFIDELNVREGVELTPADLAVSNEQQKLLVTNEAHEGKPVRRMMSKAKRKDITETFTEDEGEFDFSKHISKKTSQELSRISDMVKTNFMFQNLSPVQRDQIFQVMKLRTVVADELIIKEGDKGDEMYIIDSGQFAVLKKDDNGVNQQVFAYTTAGAAFGELSLMYGKPRAASVRAKSPGTLWSIGRQAFRAVLLKKKQRGLLDSLTTIPMMSTVQVSKLQRMCEQSYEETFDGTTIASAEVTPTWTICIILAGQVKLKSLPGEDGKSKSHSRGEGQYLAFPELGSKYTEARANGKVKLAGISKATLLDVYGEDALTVLTDSISKQRGTKAKTVEKRKSIMSGGNNNDAALVLPRLKSKDKYKLECPITTIGDFAYIANYKYIGDDAKVSMKSFKVIAKQRASSSRMDARILQERQVLAALALSCSKSSCLPVMDSCFQDAKVVMIGYRDTFMCDLALALSSGVINDSNRAICAASLYAAISALHTNGIIHRFISSGSVFITKEGIPKFVDLRYAKVMDGSKSYTICGDPLYFAPELVGNQGYNHGLDLWAFGILVHEIYEGSTPFGTVDTEETQIFRAITSYKSGQLKFSKKTPSSAVELIEGLLNPSLDERIGYRNNNDVLAVDFFAGLSWQSLGSGKPNSVDVQATVDINSILIEEELEEYSSPIFDQF